LLMQSRKLKGHFRLNILKLNILVLINIIL
jgi:hypothetical protein